MSKPAPQIPAAVIVCWSHDEARVKVRWANGMECWLFVRDNRVVDAHGRVWEVGTSSLFPLAVDADSQFRL